MYTGRCILCLVLIANFSEIISVENGIAKGRVLGKAPETIKVEATKTTNAVQPKNEPKSVGTKSEAKSDDNTEVPEKAIKDLSPMMLVDAKSILICCAEYIPKGTNSGMCSFTALGLFEKSRRKEFHEKMSLGKSEKQDHVSEAVLKRLRWSNKDLDWNDQKNKDLVKTLTKEVMDVIKEDMEKNFGTPDRIAEGMQESMKQLGTPPPKPAEKSWGFIPATCFPKEYQPFHPRFKNKEEDEQWFESMRKAIVDATSSLWSMMWPSNWV